MAECSACRMVFQQEWQKEWLDGRMETRIALLLDNQHFASFFQAWSYCVSCMYHISMVEHELHLTPCINPQFLTCKMSRLESPPL